MTSSGPDNDLTALGEGYFYFVRYDGPSTSVDWGTSSSSFFREATSGCAP